MDTQSKKLLFLRVSLSESYYKNLGINEFKSVVTPSPINFKLNADEGELFMDPRLYMCLVRKMNFIRNTGPGLEFTE